MITLITGGPGTGKTAWVLDHLVKLSRTDPRDLYIHGVRNLRGIAHEQIFCESQLCDICTAIPYDYEIVNGERVRIKRKLVENWHNWKTPGALIVVDEVQRIWRPRSTGSQMPAGVSGLETHRHYGVDLILISQGPHLFDSAIRLLVGRHVHLLARWSGRTQYEWPECKQNVQSRSDAVKLSYTLPKNVYSMYDSAEIHTKQIKRKPITLYIVCAALVFAALGLTTAIYRIKQRIAPSKSVDVVSTSQTISSTDDKSNTNTAQLNAPIDNPDDFYKHYTPVVAGVPWSAPAYVELAKPVSMPILAGCILSKKEDRCNCYTQQGTVIDMDYVSCSYSIAHRAFNPFKPNPESISKITSVSTDSKLSPKNL